LHVTSQEIIQSYEGIEVTLQEVYNHYPIKGEKHLAHGPFQPVPFCDSVIHVINQISWPA